MRWKFIRMQQETRLSLPQKGECTSVSMLEGRQANVCTLPWKSHNSLYIPFVLIIKVGTGGLVWKMSICMWMWRPES